MKIAEATQRAFGKTAQKAFLANSRDCIFDPVDYRSHRARRHAVVRA